MTMKNGSPDEQSAAFPIEQALKAVTPLKVVFATLVVVAVVVAFLLIVKYNLIIIGLAGAIVISTAVRPAVDWMERRGVPRGVGGVTIFVILLIALVAVAISVIPLITGEGMGIMPVINDYYTTVRDTLVNSTSNIIAYVANKLPLTLVSSTAAAPETAVESADQLNAAGAFSLKLLSTLFILAMVFLLSLVITVDRNSIMLVNLFFVPVDKRPEVRQFIEEIEKVISDWVRGQALLCLIIGVMSAVLYFALGLPYALLMALIAGIMEAIPIIGPFLGAVPALAVALTMGNDKVLWVVVGTLVIQQLENHLLVPRVMKKSVGVSPVITLLAFVFFTSLFGLAGGLLAVPVAASAMLIASRLLESRRQKSLEAEITGRSRLEVLRFENNELQEDVRGLVRDRELDEMNAQGDFDAQLEMLAAELGAVLTEASESEQAGAA